ncbi:MAG: hypothetical protein GY856_29775 [bacterium]|nr:hypothetical protein [bacterium]
MKRTLAIVVAFLGLIAPSTAWTGEAASTVDLSPASWPPGELEKYSELEYDYYRPNPRGVGRHGLVVGAASALSVRAGLEALKQGGTAADAAIVTSLAQVTLEAGCWVSFAGIFNLTYYDAATGEVYYLDAGYNTVERETDPLSIPPLGTPSGRSALVPGFMAGIGAAHQRFGALPWASVLEPAIYFAEEGFRIDPMLGRTIEYRADVLNRLPATRAVFTSPDGDLYQTGEHFTQPELAKTFKRVARRGAEDMYWGVWARRFVQAVRAEGGNMAMSDMRAYEAIWSAPVRIRYRDYEIFAPGPPASGGITITDALERIEPYDLAALGRYTESADALYALIDATRAAYFGGNATAGSHSQAVIAIDEAGNIAAVLHSINTLSWGTTGIFVDGVSVPDSAAFQQQRILETGPGQRLPAGINPLIVLRDGRPFLASSAIGSGLFEETIQGVVNVLDYGMDPKKAQHVPTFRYPDSNEPSYPTRVTRGDFSASLLDSVRAMGIPIVEEAPEEAEGFGYWIGAIIEPGSGRRIGATSNVFNGHAEGY